MLWISKLKISPFLQVRLQSMVVLCSCHFPGGWGCLSSGWGCWHCARNGARLAQPPAPLKSLVLTALKSPPITDSLLLSCWDEGTPLRGAKGASCSELQRHGPGFSALRRPPYITLRSFLWEQGFPFLSWVCSQARGRFVTPPDVQLCSPEGQCR